MRILSAITGAGRQQRTAEELPEGLRVHIAPLTDIFNALNITFIPNIFLADTFARVELIDETGTTKADLSSPQPTDTVRFYCGPEVDQTHIHIDVIPATEGSTEKISWGGWKYSYLPEGNGDSSDPKNIARAQMAIKERAFTFITAIEAAKAKGWPGVEFEDMNDPIERYILKLACRKLGMPCNEPDVTPPEGAKSDFQDIKNMFDDMEELRMMSIMIDGDEAFSASSSTNPAHETNPVPENDDGPVPANGAPSDLETFRAQQKALAARFG